MAIKLNSLQTLDFLTLLEEIEETNNRSRHLAELVSSSINDMWSIMAEDPANTDCCSDDLGDDSDDVGGTDIDEPPYPGDLLGGCYSGSCEVVKVYPCSMELDVDAILEPDVNDEKVVSCSCGCERSCANIDSKNKMSHVNMWTKYNPVFAAFKSCVCEDEDVLNSVELITDYFCDYEKYRDDIIGEMVSFIVKHHATDDPEKIILLGAYVSALQDEGYTLYGLSPDLEPNPYKQLSGFDFAEDNE